MSNLLLSFLRQQSGDKPEKMAELLGIELREYQELEQGTAVLTESQIKLISEAYGVGQEWLEAAADQALQIRFYEKKLRRQEWEIKVLKLTAIRLCPHSSKRKQRKES